MIAFIVIYLMISVAAAQWASTKGRDFWTVFFICVAISPLFLITMWRPFKAK